MLYDVHVLPGASVETWREMSRRSEAHHDRKSVIMQGVQQGHSIFGLKVKATIYNQWNLPERWRRTNNMHAPA